MKRSALLLLLAAGAALPSLAHASSFVFVPGNLVVSVEGAGIEGGTGTYVDNQAAPLTLFQFSHTGTASATYVNSLVLPQTSSGTNSAISGEYGSSSEGSLQLTGNGQYLTVMGYGVNAATFNANPTAYGTAVNDPTKPKALGQSGSLTGQSYKAVPRVVATIGDYGQVNTSTTVYNVFNGNNPRSVYSPDGKTFYISGQGTGNGTDATGGVFYTTLGSHSATAITGQDTSGGTLSQDTRDVQIYNNQLYVSVDTKGGSNNARDFIGTLGAQGALPTSLANSGNGPAMLPGYGNSGGTGKVTLTKGQTNGINAKGEEINLSPENFFFANATTLYVADSGQPKNNSVTKDSAGSTLGDGGLQKWSLVGGSWTLDYTLATGLNLVPNTASSGVTGLLGLTGEVVGGEVELFATSYTIGDTDQGYLYGITDDLLATSKPSGETFSVLAAAPSDSTFKGVSFAPTGTVPEPSSWAMMITGIGMIGALIRRRGMALA